MWKQFIDNNNFVRMRTQKHIAEAAGIQLDLTNRWESLIDLAHQMEKYELIFIVCLYEKFLENIFFLLSQKNDNITCEV